MKHALLLGLALACGAALAQHDHASHTSHAKHEKHGASVKVLKAQDPDKRNTPAGVVITPKEGETMDHASMHAIPVGTGAAPDGGAWLRIDVDGDYLIHNATVLGFPGGNPMHMDANNVYRVLPHKGPLIWTPPGGKMGPVPKENLIPPTTVKK